MNNGRFAISIHILTLLANNKDEFISSEYLAGSININPVLVRKELINLKSHGLIESKEGKSGGSRLAKPANKILFSDVYESVKPESLLGYSKNEANPKCEVGKQIKKNLEIIYDQAENAMIKKLKETTLADFCKKFR